MIRTTTSVLLTLALGAAFAAPASAFEPGEVLWGRKINFQPPNNVGLSFGDQFGRNVDRIGDLDGDGIEELIVGASHSDDAGLVDSGAAWILFLNPDATVRATQRISMNHGGFVGPLVSGDQFGKGVGSIGDFDGDGIPDVAVGAPKDNGGDGAIYLLYLNADGTVKEEHKIGNGIGGFTANFSGGWAGDGDNFGRMIFRMGDMDGDGVTEIAVGASNFNEIGNGTYGVTYILYMNADGTVKSHVRIGQQNGGFQMSGIGFFAIGGDNVGDWDGNGIDDIMIGASHENTAGFQWAGTVYLFTLSPQGTVLTTTRITQGHNGFTGDLDVSDQFGRDVALIGDVDGDGINDIAVGASEDDDGNGNPTNTGAVWILFMNADKTVRTQQKISNDEGRFPWTLNSNYELGISVTGIGDFNGDGVPDICAGARFDTGRGAIYVLNLNDGNQTPVNALFSASPLSGPQPLAVQFNDLTSGDVSAWIWDFGDGGTSNEQSPLHVYDTPGTYTVTLLASGTGGYSTRVRTNLITVDPPLPPVAAFSGAPLSGPAPLDVDFTDTSTGVVTAWSWDFGDGGMSTEQDPTHQYTSAGDYTVTLSVTGPGGMDSETLVDYVSVEAPIDPPVAGFSGTPLAGDAPLEVTFTDETTGMVTAWSWDFGDGDMSTEASPVHTYLTPGVYTVALTATGPGGSDVESLIDYVTVSAPPDPPVAGFSGTPFMGDAPLEVTFTDATTGTVTSWSWDFGDGGMSTLQSPVHTYTTPGTYTVMLTATGPDGSDFATLVDYVEVTEPPNPPVASFTGSPTTGDAPLEVTFTDTSTGDVTAWSWDFGDGGMSTLQNPVHMYTEVGFYTVTLTATGPDGSDADQQVDYVTVGAPAPVAAFSGTPLTGDAPLEVAFTDESSGDVTAWSWDFGDGNGSTEESPLHTYVDPGDYTVSLTVTGPGGSDQDVQVDYVSVATPAPVADFSGSPLSGDAPLEVAFSDLSTGTITSWSWAFGDGGSSTEASPAYTYLQPGDYSVTLTVEGPGGSDSTTKTDYVSVAVPPPPVANWSADPTFGIAPLAVDFTDLSTGYVTTWSWTFDGVPSSTQQDPMHVFGAGLHDVTLTVTGPGGSDSFTALDVIAVLAFPSGQMGDPSFELQMHSGPPDSPWDSNSEANEVRSGAMAGDNGMPAQGDRWLEVSAAGTSATTPPSNPGGETDPAVGGASVSQPFLIVDGRSQISFSAAFLLDGAAQSASFNDWMSVDVSDGVTTQNLYYRDSFSDFPETSAIHGLPMTEVERITVDLAERFPGLTDSTLLTLSIQVGNGGDDLAPSIGYVDDIELGFAEIVRYGCLNPEDSLTVLGGTPFVGTTLTLGVDNPLGTQGPSSATTLIVSFDPDPGYPCGLPLGGFGMAGGGAAGELLVGVLPPNPATVVVGAPWSTAGVPAPVDLVIPPSAALVGVDVYLQALVSDPAVTFGLRFGLTDALKVTLGE